LKTGDVEPDDSEEAEKPAKAEKQDNSAASSSKVTVGAKIPAPIHKPHGLYDRHIAPEMKDYTQICRVGHLLILPAGLH
jgi:hypothetical protein